ncbi:MAG: metallophosphoesterase family protein [Acidimicrobiia bacterium]
MLLVADVHGAFDALGRVARRGDSLVILGDLINLIDYRTMEGIVPDVIGSDIVEEVVRLRAEERYEEASEFWRRSTQLLDVDVRSAVGSLMQSDYEVMQTSLRGASGFVLYGNVDDPEVLKAHLPEGMEFVDAETRTINGLRFGFVGGGVPRIGSRGEVSEDEMRHKLAQLGPVDVLCTHVPPEIDMLAQDVISSPAKGSTPVLEYIDEHEPMWHFFGDVHQPRATTWLRGATRCTNVGYFRATGRPHVFLDGD